MKEGQIFRKVVFLDTMTLHCIRLCLEHAKKDGLQFPTDKQAVSRLKNHFGNVQEKPLKESLQKGLETIIRLSTDDIQSNTHPSQNLRCSLELLREKHV